LPASATALSIPVSGAPASIAPLDDEEELELLDEDELEPPEEEELLLDPLELLEEAMRPLELPLDVEEPLEDVLPLEEDTVETVAGDSLLESEQAAMRATTATEEKARMVGLRIRACLSAIEARATWFSARTEFVRPIAPCASLMCE
jgi:hypothetical protein